MKYIKLTLTLLCLSFSLQSCFVAGAAAGAAAIVVVYDHRTISNTLEDTKIANKIVANLSAYKKLWKDSHIGVTVFNHVALLTGQTPNKEWRQLAGEISKSVEGVDKVYNQITIQGPTSSLTRTSDSWITTKIRTEMLAEQNLKSSSIKVVTENGDVFLMGIVSRQQADIAVDIARKVSGVQRVIKIFSYTNPIN
ncbi:MAG TPA: BON domain-containing protein [Gammaproteobacteria bacterium]|jgi:osmotically-inducible protein OsmY|nr:BON domain-containing protein [Gammaproteobacteria bacterium]